MLKNTNQRVAALAAKLSRHKNSLTVSGQPRQNIATSLHGQQQQTQIGQKYRAIAEKRSKSEFGTLSVSILHGYASLPHTPAKSSKPNRVSQYYHNVE